jgi:hypothetical protein
LHFSLPKIPLPIAPQAPFRLGEAMGNGIRKRNAIGSRKEKTENIEWETRKNLGASG